MSSTNKNIETYHLRTDCDNFMKTAMQSIMAGTPRALMENLKSIIEKNVLYLHAKKEYARGAMLAWAYRVIPLDQCYFTRSVYIDTFGVVDEDDNPICGFKFVRDIAEISLCGIVIYIAPNKETKFPDPTFV